MTEEVAGYCSEAGCDAARGGACIENRSVLECPHFNVGAPEPDETQQSPVQVVAEEIEPIPVRAGESFSALEVDRFLRETASSVTTVALVGDPEVGKTTLISSLYELVRSGRMAYGFAGSETLRGLEQRCHLSRTRSGRKLAATQRTRTLGGLSFLHLKLAESRFVRRELILSDRPGEDYETILKRPQAALEFQELAKFDVVVILIDCERLKDPSERQIQIARTRRIWLAMERQGLIQPGRRYQMVLTKIDELVDEQARESVRQLFSDLEAEIQGRLPDANIKTSEVAARPPKRGSTPYGLGLEALVKSWLSPKPARPFKSSIRYVDSESPFDRMTVRFSQTGDDQ